MTNDTNGTTPSETALSNAHLMTQMTHELLTPMFGIIGAAELLENTPLSDEQREYTTTITASANALMALMHNILDFSSIEEGTLTFAPETYDLFTMMYESAREYSIHTRHTDVELLFTYSADVSHYIVGDKTRTKQMCTFLIAQAAHYTQNGSIRVAVDITDKGTLRITITDTGVPMTQDDIVQLMQTDPRETRMQSERAKRSGLGVAIIRQLASRMGGQFDIHSTKSGETECMLILPYTPAEAQPSTPPLPRLEGYRVLLVHSHSRASQTYEEWMGTQGAECTVALTAEEALSLCEKAASDDAMYDAIVVNEHLEDMHGETFAWAFFQTYPSLHPQFILLSSEYTDAEYERMRCVGITCLLAKPLTPLHLTHAIAQKHTPDISALTSTSDEDTPPEASVPRTASVLVAEDNDINRTVIVAMLKKAGHRVEAVANGEECLSLFQPGKYDVVFLDCRMPVMNGYETAQKIREMEGDAQRTPVIAVTANVIEDNRQKCLDAGMDDYIAKPIRSEDIESAVRRWSSH